MESSTAGNPKAKSSFWPSKEDLQRQKWAYFLTIIAILGSALAVAYWNKVEADRAASLQRYSSGFRFEDIEEPQGAPTLSSSKLSTGLK